MALNDNHVHFTTWNVDPITNRRYNTVNDFIFDELPPVVQGFETSITPSILPDERVNPTTEMNEIHIRVFREGDIQRVAAALLEIGRVNHTTTDNGLTDVDSSSWGRHLDVDDIHLCTTRPAL